MLRIRQRSNILAVIAITLVMVVANRSQAQPVEPPPPPPPAANFDYPPPHPPPPLPPPGGEFGPPADRFPDWIDDGTFRRPEHPPYHRFADRPYPDRRHGDRHRFDKRRAGRQGPFAHRFGGHRPADRDRFADRPGPDRRRGPGGPFKHPSKHRAEPTWEIKVALKNMEALARFYEEHERWEDLERVLKRRVELPLKMAELRMLGKHLGPKAAMREFYNATDRPHRAVELELMTLEQDARKLDARKASLDRRIGQLQGMREGMEGRFEDIARRIQALTEQIERESRSGPRAEMPPAP